MIGPGSTRRTLFTPARALALFAAAAMVLLGASAKPAQGAVNGETVEDIPPWIAILYRNTDDFNCSGSLIRPTIVLVAKHCIDADPPGALSVAIGHSGADPIPEEELIRVEDFAMDPNPASDVGFVKIAERSAARPARMIRPYRRAPYRAGTESYFMGYGLSGNEFTGRPLSRIDGLNLSTEECTEAIDGLDPTTAFCFRAHQTIGDGCFGDSGGPVVTPNRLGRPMVIGTVWGGTDVGCVVGGVSFHTRLGGDPVSEWLEANLPPAERPKIIFGDVEVRKDGVTAEVYATEQLESAKVRLQKGPKQLSQAVVPDLGPERVTVELEGELRRDRGYRLRAKGQRVQGGGIGSARKIRRP